jgi:hypothetical protein
VVLEGGARQRRQQDVGQVVGALAAAGLAQQQRDVRAVEGVRGAGLPDDRGGAVLGGHHRLRVTLQELEVGAAEGQQPLARRGARADRRRAADERVLELRLVLGEDRAGEPRAVPEAAEQRSLAHAGLGGHGVHGDRRRAVGREQPGRGGQHAAAVLGRVGALRALALEDGE